MQCFCLKILPANLMGAAQQVAWAHQQVLGMNQQQLSAFSNPGFGCAAATASELRELRDNCAHLQCHIAAMAEQLSKMQVRPQPKRLSESSARFFHCNVPPLASKHFSLLSVMATQRYSCLCPGQWRRAA